MWISARVCGVRNSKKTSVRNSSARGRHTTAMEGSNLRYITAPMVGQSDLPFRVLCRMHGATLSCTQMLMPDKLLNEQDYLEYHLKDLKTATDLGLEQPVVVQLCGNDPESIVKAGRILQNHCQGIGNIWLLNQYIQRLNTNLWAIRFESWVSTKARSGRTFWCLLAGTEWLASSWEDRYERL